MLFFTFLDIYNFIFNPCWPDASPWVHRGHWLSLLPTGGLCGKGSWLRNINNWKSPGWPKRIKMFPIMPPEWWLVGACQNMWPWRKTSVDLWVLGRSCLGMVSQGVSARQARAWALSPLPGSLVAPTLLVSLSLISSVASVGPLSQISYRALKSLVCSASEVSSFLFT